MPEFFKQYRFKDTGAPVQSWDQFLNIRIGARLIKNTGDEYQKTSDHVYEKVNRYYLSNEDIEGKFVELDKTNILTKPQFITAEPTEPYHITNKEYVDALVATAAVDLSGFARLDVENSWLKPQLCNAEPKFRTHLTNKGYVDDRINGIEFDTTALAKLNNPNVFTAPQSVTVPAIAPEHLVTKQYVDDTKEYLVNNFSGFVRADLPNTYTATQDFQFKITVPYPKVDLDAANKLYVDTKVKETQQSLGNFAALDLENIFEKDQTFRKAAICSSTPSMPYHLANKEYVDSVASSGTVPDGIAFIDQDNVWMVKQNFGSGLTAPPPEGAQDCANKEYVDAQILAAEVPMASDTIAGKVKLTNTDITAEDFAKSNDVPTSKGVARYVVTQIPDLAPYPTLSGTNIFTRPNTFELGLTAGRDIAVGTPSGAVKIGREYLDYDTISWVENYAPGTPPEDQYHLNDTEYSYIMDVGFNASGNVIKGGKCHKVLGGPAYSGLAAFPEVVHTPAVDLGNTRIGVTPGELNENDEAAYYVLGNVTYIPALNSSEDGPGLDLAPDYYTACLGFKLVPGDRLYACSNLAPDIDGIDDELPNANWITESPYIAKTLDTIKVDFTGFDHEKLADATDISSAYYALRTFTTRGVAKVKDTSIDFALKLLSNRVTIISTAKNKTLKLTDADVVLKDLKEFTIELIDCKAHLKGFTGNAAFINCDVVISESSGTMSAVDSKVSVRGLTGGLDVNNCTVIAEAMNGNIAASRKSHIKLAKGGDLSTLNVTASIYSTVDNIDNTCKVTLDQSCQIFKTDTQI